MNSNKILILLLVLTITVSGAIVFFLFSSKEDGSQFEAIQAEAIQTAISRGEVFDDTGNTLQTTPGEYYLVYEVAIDNPTEEAYSIFYSENDKRFKLVIPSRPFDQMRAQAEAKFLQLVGFESRQQDACKLNVRILVPKWGDPIYAEQILPLSFCVKE